MVDQLPTRRPFSKVALDETVRGEEETFPIQRSRPRAAKILRRLKEWNPGSRERGCTAVHLLSRATTHVRVPIRPASEGEMTCSEGKSPRSGVKSPQRRVNTVAGEYSRQVRRTDLSSADRVPSRASQTDTRNLRSTSRGSGGPANGTRSAAAKSWPARAPAARAENARTHEWQCTAFGRWTLARDVERCSATRTK